MNGTIFSTSRPADSQSFRIYLNRRIGGTKSKPTNIVAYYGSITLTAIIIRKLQNHIIKKLSTQEWIKKNNVFARIVNRLNNYYKNEERITKISLKREKYIESKTGKIATFFFAIFCFLPIIADIISIRILYKKIKFPYFILAVIIGKSIAHIPFIFLGKTIVDLLHI